MKLSFDDKTQAFRYMGYTNENIPENIRLIAEKCEKLLIETINPLYRINIFDIEFLKNGVYLCGSNFTMLGNDIKNHLKGCVKAVLICATLGIKVDKLIKQLSITDMSKSFITDALASMLIEQVCDIAEDEIKKTFSDMYMTWRFSPGYGDFPISQQKEFLTVTNAAKNIGLNLSDSNILIPTKSVTAVIGLSFRPLENKRKGCIICNMKDRCSFRKRGVHCEF